MATAGYTSRIFLNGYRISPYLNSIEAAKQFDTEEVSTFESQGKKYLATKSDATSGISGWWDENVDDILEAAFDGSESVISYYPAGAAAGAYGKLFKAIETEVGSAPDQGGAVNISGSFQSTEIHRSIRSIITETTYATTTSSASLDGGAQTTGGGVAVVHCTAVTGTVAVVIEDSPDNSTWSTLVAATDFSAVGAQILAISGTIERYVRVTATLGGGESITLQAGINRVE